VWPRSEFDSHSMQDRVSSPFLLEESLPATVLAPHMLCYTPAADNLFKPPTETDCLGLETKYDQRAVPTGAMV
jgi:hypothetical protein